MVRVVAEVAQIWPSVSGLEMLIGLGGWFAEVHGYMAAISSVKLAISPESE